jgi:hypothetical protein
MMDNKKIILNAYFKRVINKNEMKFLFRVGIIVPPIPWFYEYEEKNNEENKKRELVEKILGYRFPKIEWVN